MVVLVNGLCFLHTYADSTLVAGAGQRFESARRLSTIGLSKRNNRNK